MPRHPLAALVRHWPAGAVEALEERRAILQADGLDQEAAEEMVRKEWTQPAPRLAAVPTPAAPPSAPAAADPAGAPPGPARGR